MQINLLNKNKIKESQIKDEDLETLDLKQIMKLVLDSKLDQNTILMYIDACEINPKCIEYINALIESNLSSNLKIRALKKLVQAKYDFQGLYINNIYQNENIKEKELLADIILSCKTLNQVATIYIMFSEIEDDNINLIEYYALAKLITKCNNIYKTSILNDNKWISKMANLGLLLPIANLILKCKTNKQADYIKLLAYNQSVSENALLILKYCEYFLKTTDENKLFNINCYILQCINTNVLVEAAKINTILVSRHNYITNNIGDIFTNQILINADLDLQAAQVLNDSRKEYHARYASKLATFAAPESISSAMIVNESETKYKAEKAYSIMSLYANTDEIDKALEFAALINSVYTKVEIDLIYVLGINKRLNNLNVALPIARIIADATDAIGDVITLWESMKENKEEIIKGLTEVIHSLDPKYRKKAEKIINVALIKAQNKPLHLTFDEEVCLSKGKELVRREGLLPKKIRKDK